MKSVRLTRRAESRLVEIVDWTIEHFGIAQATPYEDQLIDRVKGIARNEPPLGKPCSVLVPELPGTMGLLYLRVGKHYVVYREQADVIAIIDFVHSSRDLPNIIATLSARAPTDQ